MANTLTASTATFEDPEHVGSYWMLSHRRDAASVEIVGVVGSYPASETTPLRVIGAWDVFTYGAWTGTLYLERQSEDGTWEVVRTWTSNRDRNVVANGTEDSEEGDLRLRVSAGTGFSADDVVPRFVLEAADSSIDGLVKITAVNSSTEAVIEVVSPVLSTDPTTRWTEGAFSDHRGHPRAIGSHQGRLWYGGTENEPAGLWASVSNDFDNYRRSSADDGSMLVAISAERNPVNWLASQGEALLIGTAGNEWMLHGDGKPITPLNAQVERQSGYGSAFLPAQGVDESIVFVQRATRKLRRIASRGDTDPWTASDLTVLAEHVTSSGIVQTAYSANPHSILWAVTGDGDLLSLSYEQEQNVFGWAVHETDGTVESVAVIHGGDVDEVWVSVDRDVKRTIERLDETVLLRDFDDPASLIYLDSAVYTAGTDLTSISGLDHLEGLDVSVLADGAQCAAKTVNAGTITLDDPADKVVVGLPFTSTLQPMRPEIPLQDGTSQHRGVKVTRVGIYVHDSLGAQVADSPSGSRWENFQFREGSDPMDSPPPLYTGPLEEPIESEERDSADVTIRQTQPHPLNVGSITFMMDVHDI